MLRDKSRVRQVSILLPIGSDWDHIVLGNCVCRLNVECLSLLKRRRVVDALTLTMK